MSWVRNYKVSGKNNERRQKTWGRWMLPGEEGDFTTAKTIKNLGTDIEKLKTELIPRSGSGIKWQTKLVKVKEVVIGPRGRSSAIDPNLKSFHGARWGVALHCSMLAGEQAGVPSKERKEQQEEGRWWRDSSLALDKASSHFFHASLPPPLNSFFPPLLASGCSMQNGLCLRAVAWNKTKKGLRAAENASFVSAAIHTVLRRGSEEAQRECLIAN